MFVSIFLLSLCQYVNQFMYILSYQLGESVIQNFDKLGLVDVSKAKMWLLVSQCGKVSSVLSYFCYKNQLEEGKHFLHRIGFVMRKIGFIERDKNLCRYLMYGLDMVIDGEPQHYVTGGGYITNFPGPVYDTEIYDGQNFANSSAVLPLSVRAHCAAAMGPDKAMVVTGKKTKVHLQGRKRFNF